MDLLSTLHSVRSAIPYLMAIPFLAGVAYVILGLALRKR